jgi:PAT family beta-lactamase induction signal transducer AmpG
MLSGLKGFVAARAPEGFATALERSGVTPAALGTGYVVFFAYSALIGAFAVVLAVAVQRRQPGEQPLTG